MFMINQDKFIQKYGKQIINIFIMIMISTLEKVYIPTFTNTSTN